MHIDIDTADRLKDEFIRCKRGNSFTYDGFHALFTMLKEFEDSRGQSEEVDVIGIDSEWLELPLYDVLANHNFTTFKELNEVTTATLLDDNRVVYLNFN